MPPLNHYILSIFANISIISFHAIKFSDDGSVKEKLELPTSLPLTVVVESSDYESDNLYDYVAPPAQVQLYQKVRNSNNEGVSTIPPKLAASSHKKGSCSDKSTEDSGVIALSLDHTYQPLKNVPLEDKSYDMARSKQRKQIDVRGGCVCALQIYSYYLSCMLVMDTNEHYL